MWITFINSTSNFWDLKWRPNIGHTWKFKILPRKLVDDYIYEYDFPTDEIVLFSALANRETVLFSPGQAQSGAQPSPLVPTIVPEIRKEFPETWIIEDFKK